MKFEAEGRKLSKCFFLPFVHEDREKGMSNVQACPLERVGGKIGSKLVHVVVEWPLMVFARMGSFSLFARTKKVSDYSKRSLYPQFHQITGQSQY